MNYSYNTTLQMIICHIARQLQTTYHVLQISDSQRLTPAYRTLGVWRWWPEDESTTWRQESRIRHRSALEPKRGWRAASIWQMAPRPVETKQTIEVHQDKRILNSVKDAL